MSFRVICAWCSQVLCEGDPGAPTSHTACDACARRLLGDWEQQKKDVA